MFKKQHKKILILSLILVLAILIIWLVWWVYDIQLTEIDNHIKRLN